MKLYDMGETRDTKGEIACSSQEDNKEKYYPTTYLSSNKLPGIEEYDIGDECKICSVNKIIGKREKEDGEVEVEVEIRRSGIMGSAKVSEEEYKSMSEEEKDKADEEEVMEE